MFCGIHMVSGENFTASGQATILYNELEKLYFLKLLPHLQGNNELSLHPTMHCSHYPDGVSFQDELDDRQQCILQLLDAGLSFMTDPTNPHYPLPRAISLHFSSTIKIWWISYCCNSIIGHQIATKFGTCHDSTAVVACTKFWSDHFLGIWMTAKWNFIGIWTELEKWLVKWTTAPLEPYRAS